MKKQRSQSKLYLSFMTGVIWTGSLFAAPEEPVATYLFNNTLNAAESGPLALTPIDPLSQNGFITDSVYGEERQVYRFDGTRTASEAAGLSLSSQSALGSSNIYSVEMVFQFETSNTGGYKNIFGVSNRQKDLAFYVNPQNKLQVYPEVTGKDDFSYDQYHHVILTTNGSGNVSFYFDGILQAQDNSPSMDFNSFLTENPERFIHFFVDNGNEVSDGRIAMLKLYNEVLNEQDAKQLSENPFNRCQSSYSSQDVLKLPCTKVIDSFGAISMYDADLKLTSTNPLTFQLVSAQQIQLSEINQNNNTVGYEDGDVTIPYVIVSNAFGGSITYQATLKLIPQSNPLTFTLSEAVEID